MDSKHSTNITIIVMSVSFSSYRNTCNTIHTILILLKLHQSFLLNDYSQGYDFFFKEQNISAIQE